MKNVLITIFSGALMLGVAVAQHGAASPSSQSPEPQTSAPAQPSAQPQPSTQPQAQPSQGASSTPADAPKRIAPGSVIPVALTKTIDAKKAKTGDEVVAKVTQDMKTTSGEVLVPKDTKVVGHVTEAQSHSKEQKESQVGIAFDRAVMKDGGEMQMPMSIQAIIGPQNNQNNAGGGNGNGEPRTGPSPSTGRGGAMGGSQPNPNPSPSAGAGNVPADAQEGTSARPQITAKTEGVIGLSDLKLTTTPPSANEGSVVSSDKNNVKLESGTMMLLRVNQ